MEWTPEAIAAALEEANVLVRSDGAALVLLSADARSARVELRLEVDDARCATGACVLPRDMLEPLIVAALRRHLPGELEVLLHDPRAA